MNTRIENLSLNINGEYDVAKLVTLLHPNPMIQQQLHLYLSQDLVKHFDSQWKNKIEELRIAVDIVELTRIDKQIKKLILSVSNLKKTNYKKRVWYEYQHLTNQL